MSLDTYKKDLEMGVKDVSYVLFSASKAVDRLGEFQIFENLR